MAREMRGRRRRAQEGSIRDHLFEAIDCALNLAAVRDVLFDFVDEGRDRNAARVCGRIGAAAGDLLAGPERIWGSIPRRFGDGSHCEALGLGRGTNSKISRCLNMVGRCVLAIPSGAEPAAGPRPHCPLRTHSLPFGFGAAFLTDQLPKGSISW